MKNREPGRKVCTVSKWCKDKEWNRFQDKFASWMVYMRHGSELMQVVGKIEAGIEFKYTNSI